MKFAEHILKSGDLSMDMVPSPFYEDTTKLLDAVSDVFLKQAASVQALEAAIAITAKLVAFRAAALCNIHLEESSEQDLWLLQTSDQIKTAVLEGSMHYFKKEAFNDFKKEMAQYSLLQIAGLEKITPKMALENGKKTALAMFEKIKSSMSQKK